MRASLPGAVRETEDWPALMTAAGLRPSGTRTFLLDLPAPLTDEARAYVVASLTHPARCSRRGSTPRTAPPSTASSTPTTRRACTTARTSSCSRPTPVTRAGGTRWCGAGPAAAS